MRHRITHYAFAPLTPPDAPLPSATPTGDSGAMRLGPRDS